MAKPQQAGCHLLTSWVNNLLNQVSSMPLGMTKLKQKIFVRQIKCLQLEFSCLNETANTCFFKIQRNALAYEIFKNEWFESKIGCGRGNKDGCEDLFV